MALRGTFALVVLLVSLLGVVKDTRAQSYNALAECIALSPLLDHIHACMDNYLDLLDENISTITDFLAESLTGNALDGLLQSNQAFADYRRQNCIWYLNFSSPREEAEQIAKNCLANMSQQRLQELQALVSTENKAAQILKGFYVFGPERNSFQACGSDDRYWLEGNTESVSQAQQLYLAIATDDLQVLFASFAGEIDEQVQVPAGHSGVLNVEATIEMRVPIESDCRLPSTSAEVASADSSPNVEPLSAAEIDEIEPEEQDEPQEQLIAYFGAWVVDCTDTEGNRICRLSVSFEPGLSNAVQSGEAELAIVRMKQQVTQLELQFAGREIDSPARIRWWIDAVEFGDIVGSEIRVDESATRQLIPSGRFLRNDLLPMLLDGAEVRVEVLQSVDDSSGELYSATLLGLTKAIGFADDYLQGGSF